MSNTLLNTTAGELHDPVLIMTTTGRDDPTEWFFELIEQKLAACVTKLPMVESSYRWQGKIVTDQETIWLIKTTRSCCAHTADFIKRHHRYDVPEIAVIELSAINPEYQRWLAQSVELPI